MVDGEFVEEDPSAGLDDGRFVPGDQKPERPLRDAHPGRGLCKREKGRAAWWVDITDPGFPRRSRRFLQQRDGSVPGAISAI